MPKSKYITVKQLIEEFGKLDQNRIVILQKDEEGNGYGKLWGIYNAAARYEQNEWIVGLEELTEKDKEMGYTEEDVIKGKKVVVLVPAE